MAPRRHRSQRRQKKNPRFGATQIPALTHTYTPTDIQRDAYLHEHARSHELSEVMDDPIALGMWCARVDLAGTDRGKGGHADRHRLRHDLRVCRHTMGATCDGNTF